MNAQMGLFSVCFFITRIKDQGTLCVNPCWSRRTEDFELCLDCCNNLGCIDFLNCVKIRVETTSSSSCNLQLNQGRAHCCITVAPHPSDDGTPDLHQGLQMVLHCTWQKYLCQAPSRIPLCRLAIVTRSKINQKQSSQLVSQLGSLAIVGGLKETIFVPQENLTTLS